MVLCRVSSDGIHNKVPLLAPFLWNDLYPELSSRQFVGAVDQIMPNIFRPIKDSPVQFQCQYGMTPYTVYGKADCFCGCPLRVYVGHHAPPEGHITMPKPPSQT